MKKLLSFLIILIFFSFFNSFVVTAIEPPVPLDPKTTNSKNTTIYTLLAPIGNLVCIDTNTDSKTREKACALGGIGDYFSVFLKIAIGLAAVLAVIMIIVNAIKYMGGDSVFNKEEGKHGITAALLGLIIALGSYALLNTINPALLGQNGLTFDQAKVQLDEDPITTDIKTPIPTGGVAKCSSGISRLETFGVCNDIKSNLSNLLTSAKGAGYNIAGGGFRTRARQEQLRSQYCGGAANINNKNATCKPLTALPGNSMHESGKAFDFTCDGSVIRAKDNKCFLWLKANAGNYGLSNLINGSEPWHWSVDGR